MKDRISNIRTLTTIIVIFCFAIGLIFNLYKFVILTNQKLTSEDTQNSSNKFSDIENSFRDNIAYRNKMVNLYGIYQKTIGHTIVGNFEYVADEYGILHMINNYSPYQTDNFIQEMSELKTYLEEQNVPLLYVQAPNREIVNDNSVITDFNIDDETMNIVVEALRNNEIQVLDIRDELINDSPEFELSNLFFHTDLHMQTDSEIWMEKQLAIYLQNNMGVNINNMEYLTDMSLYNKVSYNFVGNYGRTYGKYFVDEDKFDIYHPKFDTSFEYYIPGDEATHISGKFEDVLMNGYESQPVDDYTYWVTDFMHFMVPYYTYVNNMQSSGNLLVITDSMGYRGLSYLALTTHQITILDPRFFGGVDYVKLALQEQQYDAVIVLQGNYLIGVPLIVQ